MKSIPKFGKLQSRNVDVEAKTIDGFHLQTHAVVQNFRLRSSAHAFCAVNRGCSASPGRRGRIDPSPTSLGGLGCGAAKRPQHLVSLIMPSTVAQANGPGSLHSAGGLVGSRGVSVSSSMRLVTDRRLAETPCGLGGASNTLGHWQLRVMGRYPARTGVLCRVILGTCAQAQKRLGITITKWRRLASVRGIWSPTD